MAKPTLYLLVGYPGAGKTTVSRFIANLTAAKHIWADYERHQMFNPAQHTHEENLALYAELNKLTEKLLSQGKSVIFDTNFNFYKDREHLRQIASKHGANTVLVWVKTSKPLAKHRATELEEEHFNRVWGNMPVKDFDRITSHLQEPLNEEHVTIDGSNITKAGVKKALNL